MMSLLLTCDLVLSFLCELKLNIFNYRLDILLQNWEFLYLKEFLDKRKMTDWGSLALVDEGQGDYKGKSLALPGVRAGDLSSRSWRPEVQVASVQFSPTGEFIQYLVLDDIFFRTFCKFYTVTFFL